MENLWNYGIVVFLAMCFLGWVVAIVYAIVRIAMSPTNTMLGLNHLTADTNWMTHDDGSLHGMEVEPTRIIDSDVASGDVYIGYNTTTTDD